MHDICMQVEEVMNDFEESMRKFEVLFSKIYLQEVTVGAQS